MGNQYTFCRECRPKVADFVLIGWFIGLGIHHQWHEYSADRPCSYLQFSVELHLPTALLRTSIESFFFRAHATGSSIPSEHSLSTAAGFRARRIGSTHGVHGLSGTQA